MRPRSAGQGKPDAREASHNVRHDFVQPQSTLPRPPQSRAGPIPRPGGPTLTQHPEAQHGGQHRRSAMRDQRQRHAAHRDEPRHHRHVHEDIQEKLRPQPHASSRPNGAGIAAPRRAEHHHQLSSASAPRADQAESSAIMVKMKSVCFSGRKFSWPCVPCRKPLPQARPSPGDLGLDDVVARPERIAFGVEESGDARPL